ncbi:PIN domain-containing protein [Methanobacterium alkalithermotolerans]|uniref:PIN domain-containing protein n=1 Tax=Methanobacterium alkalithermotolerans TaxID=2731220 RepID=A0A8T8KFB5_9EURY|nr:PIN domain-containing protein [Methanobacterium alkalithermotolerans]QUH23971.1 PIN domain-containing protein [Methanobacterium alkalithermotolerans]
MIFIDSSFFIAAINKKDQWHQKAGEILPIIKNEEKIISELILSESVTLIGSLFGGKTGIKLFNYILDNHEIHYLDKNLIFDAMEIFLKYDGTLSFADSVSVQIMKDLQIEKIVSFDSDFDKVKKIRRIYSE